MSIFASLFQGKTAENVRLASEEAVEGLRFQINEGAKIFSSDGRFERCLLSDEVIAAVLGFVLNVSRSYKVSSTVDQQKMMKISLDALFDDQLRDEFQEKVTILMSAGRPILDQGLLMTVADAKQFKTNGVQLGFIYQLMQEFQAAHPETQTDTEF